MQRRAVMKKTRIAQTMMIAAVVVLVLLLLVPLGLSFFAFPMPGDDYANTWATAEVWKNDGNVLSVISAAYHHAADIYMRLQGNFTGVLLMALNPLLVSVSAYQWALFGINLLLMASVIWMLMNLIKRRWGMDGKAVLLIALLLLFVTYNRLMSFIEFGYNFTAASYYALPFSLAMIYAAILLRMNKAQKKHPGPFMVLILLSAYLGLNNFPLALMMLTGLGFASLCAVIKKHRMTKTLLSLLIIFSVFFALSLFAPGNNRRTDTEWAENFGIVSTVYASVVMGTKLMLVALVSTPLLGVMLLLTPRLAESARQNQGRFTNPLLFAALTYIVFIVQYIPVLYAGGYDYHGRIENIKWLTALIWIVVNYINLVGYAAQRRETRHPIRLKSLTAAGGSILVLFCLWAYYIAPAKVDDALYVHRMHYETIYRQSVSGQLTTYRAEQAKRFDILNDKDIVDVEFQPLTYESVICGQETLSTDKEANRNRILAKHYDKNYILILPAE